MNAEPSAEQAAAAQAAAAAWFAEPSEAIGCVGWLEEGGIWWAIRAGQRSGWAPTVQDAWVILDKPRPFPRIGT